MNFHLQTFSDITSHALSYLRRDENQNIAMTECIYRVQAQLLEAGGDGVLLRSCIDGGCMLAAEQTEAGARLLDKLPESGHILVHDDWLLPLLRGDFPTAEALRPMKWGSFEPPMWQVTFDIWPLDAGDLDAIPLCDPSLTNREQLAQRIDANALYGACIDDQVGGIVGIHPHGGIGMLAVRPELRGQGIGKILLLSQVRRELRAGHVPFALIPEADLRLRAWMEGLGFVSAPHPIWQLCKTAREDS